MTRKTTKRIILPIVGVLGEAYKDKEALKGIKGILDKSQVRILEELIKNTLEPENRWIAYLWGFNASEIGRATGFTRANISARILNQVEGKKEEVDRKHKENRVVLFKARDWYLYVYKSDKVGDFRQMAKILPESLQNDAYMYRMYRTYGGQKIEKDFIDRRHKLSEDKINIIGLELKEKSLEQVAFQERVYPENILRLVSERNWEYFRESETGETEYTEKLNAWLEQKRELNLKDSQRRSEERRKKREERKNN